MHSEGSTGKELASELTSSDEAGVLSSLEGVDGSAEDSMGDVELFFELEEAVDSVEFSLETGAEEVALEDEEEALEVDEEAVGLEEASELKGFEDSLAGAAWQEASMAKAMNIIDVLRMPCFMRIPLPREKMAFSRIPMPSLGVC